MIDVWIGLEPAAVIVELLSLEVHICLDPEALGWELLDSKSGRRLARGKLRVVQPRKVLDVARRLIH